MTTGIASPCVGICRLRPGTRVCDGCFRSIDEIGEWITAGDEQRRRILAAAARRRREMSAPGDAAPTAGPVSPELFRGEETD